MRRVSPRVIITAGMLISAAAPLSLTTLGVTTSFGSPAWRPALLGLGLGIAFPRITSTAVSAVPGRQASMAAAGNNAFRQLGGAPGPAVLGTLLATKAADTLPGHLAEAGLSGGTAQSITDAVGAGGLGAVAGMELGADTGRATGAVSEAFLEGLRLCLTVSAVLLVLAALAAALPLRRRTGPSVTGRTNLVVSALCRNTEELYTFLSEGIGALPGVHTAETVLTLRRVKTLTAEHR